MKMTLKEVAEVTSGELAGAPEFAIDGVAPVESAGPTQLAYLTDASKKDLLASCKAGCLIMPEQAKGLDLYKGNIIYAKNPHWAFTLVLRKIDVERKPKRSWGIHPTAIVDPNAKLGKYVSIGAHSVIEKDAVIGDFSVIYPLCFIGEKVKIGSNCLIYSNVSVREECEIRDRVIIHSGAVIGADGFGYLQVNNRHEKIPQIGKVIIENDVEIGANTTIDRAALTETVIGAGTKIDNQVQIAHNVKTGMACIIVAQAGIAGSCNLGNGVIVAGQAGIVDHVNIGDGAILAASSGVMSDVPPGQMVFGAPSRPRGEAFKILAVMSKLPEMYAFFRKLKKKFGEEEKGSDAKP